MIELKNNGIKFQSDPSKKSFDLFLEANKDIAPASIPWLIAGSMFLYYLRQIERYNQIKTEIL